MFPIGLGMVELSSTYANDMPDLRTAEDTPAETNRFIVSSKAPKGELLPPKNVFEASADLVSTNEVKDEAALDHVNIKGRYEYDADFLRSLRSHPLSLKKPDLPDLNIVLQVPLVHREKKTNRSNDFLPSSMVPSRNNRSLPPRSPEQSPANICKLKNSSKPMIEYTVKEKKRSLLPLSNITENCSTKLQTIQDIEYLLGRKFTVPEMKYDAEVQERCLLFFDKDDAKKLVEKEIDYHKKNKNFSLAYQVSVLDGNLKDTIIEASRSNQLNDWLVAMSASISREFWSKTALLYAVQLEKSNESAQAALYYSCVHRTTDAVRVLLKAGLFKECLILVKNCASFNDQLTKDILNAWAKSKESQDDLEFAAKIYVANLEPEEAARCLSQRKDDLKCQSLCKILESATPLVIKPN